jgi:hypothetical protein
MGLEVSMWKALRDATAGQWSVQRLSDRLTAGLPDVLYALDARCTGLLELKAPGPGRGSLGITPEQALWLHVWRGAAGVVVRRARTRWLYLPRQPTLRWVQDIQGPDPDARCPCHVFTDPAELPALLWRLHWP